MERKNFIRNTEDFTCEHCGQKVKGTGYTNHCPACLWSKHVDNLPGDRANTCCGLMQPIDVVMTGDTYDLVHQCSKCGVIKNNKVSDNDDRLALANILAQK